MHSRVLKTPFTGYCTGFVSFFQHESSGHKDLQGINPDTYLLQVKKQIPSHRVFGAEVTGDEILIHITLPRNLVLM